MGRLNRFIMIMEIVFVAFNHVISKYKLVGSLILTDLWKQKYIRLLKYINRTIIVIYNVLHMKYKYNMLIQEKNQLSCSAETDSIWRIK